MSHLFAPAFNIQAKVARLPAPASVRDIQDLTGLSTLTIHRAVTALRSSGEIARVSQ